jgi:4-carboxymuconolactone decarboxylase
MNRSHEGDRRERRPQRMGELMADDDRFTRGLAIRTEVLGEEYVQRSLANATDFSRPLQQLVTEYCWGEVWARPGLDRRTRSLLNIAMLTALGHQAELSAHVAGALRNGASVADVQEVVLQAAIYCGVPAALNAMRTAQAAIASAAPSATASE